MPKKNSSHCIILFPSVYLFFSVVRFFSFRTLLSRILILRATHSCVKRGRASASYIFLLYSFSVYGKSIKDYWFSFCIYYPSAFPESLQLFVSALLVRCGSALLINLILAMISFANVVILWFYPFYHIIAIKLVMAQSVGEKISARKIPLSYSFVMRYFIFLQLIISIFKITIILTHYSHVYKLIHPLHFLFKIFIFKINDCKMHDIAALIYWSS